MSELSARHAEQTIRELRYENTQLRKKLGETSRHAATAGAHHPILDVPAIMRRW